METERKAALWARGSAIALSFLIPAGSVSPAFALNAAAARVVIQSQPGVSRAGTARAPQMDAAGAGICITPSAVKLGAITPSAAALIMDKGVALGAPSANSDQKSLTSATLSPASLTPAEGLIRDLPATSAASASPAVQSIGTPTGANIAGIGAPSMTLRSRPGTTEGVGRDLAAGTESASRATPIGARADTKTASILRALSTGRNGIDFEVGVVEYDGAIRLGQAPVQPPVNAARRLRPKTGLLHARDIAGSSFAGNAVLPPHFTAKDSLDEPWLAEVLEAASRSKTARRVLASAERLSRDFGQPIVVDVPYIRGDSNYDYDSDVVELSADYKRRTPPDAAAILVHEVRHWMQARMGLPSDALELELEAYILTFLIDLELGVKPERGTLRLQFRRSLSRGIGEFISAVAKRYDTDIPLLGSSLAAFEAELLRRLGSADFRLTRLRSTLTRRSKALSRMEGAEWPKKALESYRAKNILPLEERIRNQALARAWAKRDLNLLREPSARMRFRRFADHVRRMMRSAHEKLRARTA